ncbi:MAG TPA: S41 family peptidase [Solirubrobacteraceae bacterium]|nr:S41 family peptidase [Solirubrobacteraceae bacterium]
MRPRPTRRARYTTLAVVGVVVLLIGVWLGGHSSWIPSGVKSFFVNQGETQLVQQVLDDVQHQYYRPVNRSTLVDKGLASAIASLNDPYSHYFSPSEYRSFQNESNPHLSGIGVDVVPDPLGLQIVDVFPGSPAARAGLGRGDLILRVGSKSLAGRSANYASNLIRGRQGTKVTLTLRSRGHRRSVSITRANIVVPVASSSIKTYKGVKVGDLQFTSFAPPDSGDELRTQVHKVLGEGAQALVLDLRENGGGLLQEAVNVASIFIPDGTIVSTAGRSQPRQVYAAQGNAFAAHIPLVVLVDRGTASASEIVTGALQDRHRALVVGTHTYGKGVFQEIEPLPNGGALDITVGEYFTPSGRNLGGGGVREGAGITPNVDAASNPRAASDHALQVALRTVAGEVH